MRGVGKSYGDSAVLADINLSIEEGEFVALIGFSGSGKTTLMSILAGLIEPDVGQVMLRGRPAGEAGPDRGVVFQSYSLMPWLTVCENVALAVDTVFAGETDSLRRARVDKYVAMVGLGHAADRRPAELSGGMRQRVAVARALAMNPEFLLLDEPLSALDALTRAKLQDEIESIWREEKKTVVLVTNDVDEALLLADRILPLDPGPRATLGPEFRVNLARPRDRKAMNHDADVSASARSHHAVPARRAGGKPGCDRQPGQTTRSGADHFGGLRAAGGALGQQAAAARQPGQVRRVLQRAQGLPDAQGSAHGGRRIQSRRPARRVRVAHRALRLWQVDRAVDGGRTHRRDRRRHHARRSRGDQRRSGSRRGVPGAEPAAWLTARQNVALGVDRVYPHAGDGERRDIVEYYLARVGLADSLDKPARDMSNGMRQRVGLARAFALSPKLLLLDEPFGMLDALTRWDLQEVLMDILKRTRITAICVTHDVDEAVLLADRVVMMTNGPRARIGRIMQVDLPRPRTRKMLLEHPRYYAYREELLSFLEEYEHGAGSRAA